MAQLIKSLFYVNLRIKTKSSKDLHSFQKLKKAPPQAEEPSFDLVAKATVTGVNSKTHKPQQYLVHHPHKLSPYRIYYHGGAFR